MAWRFAPPVRANSAARAPSTFRSCFESFQHYLVVGCLLFLMAGAAVPASVVIVVHVAWASGLTHPGVSCCAFFLVLGHADWHSMSDNLVVLSWCA